MTLDTLTIANNTNTVLGSGVINTLPNNLEQLGITKPLICTDQGILEAGICEILKDNLQDNVIAKFFHSTPANPFTENLPHSIKKVPAISDRDTFGRQIKNLTLNNIKQSARTTSDKSRV